MHLGGCPLEIVIKFKCEVQGLPIPEGLMHAELAVFTKQVWFRTLAGDNYSVTIPANDRIDNVQNYLLRLLVDPMKVDDVTRIGLVGNTIYFK